MMMRIREHETFYRTVLMFAKILAFFGLSSCASILSKSNQPGQAKEHLEVLFIGNSYSFDVPKKLRNLARKNDKKLKVASCTHGGWKLSMHVDHEPTLKKLRSRKWDIVIIQDLSLHPAYPERRRQKEMYPFVKFFADEARALGARPMLYQTWGRRDGQPGVEGDDFYQMNARVREGYARAAQWSGVVGIVPVGDAWEAEYRAGNAQKLFIDDGSHPSDFGNQVSALVFYKSIFGCEPEITN